MVLRLWYLLSPNLLRNWIYCTIGCNILNELWNWWNTNTIRILILILSTRLWELKQVTSENKIQIDSRRCWSICWLLLKTIRPRNGVQKCATRLILSGWLATTPREYTRLSSYCLCQIELQDRLASNWMQEDRTTNLPCLSIPRCSRTRLSTW